MADISDVMSRLADLATTAVYPNGLIGPSITGRQITIGQGWPNPRALDAAIAASPPASFVTIFPVPGATGHADQYFEEPQVIVAAAHGLIVTIAANVVTVTGAPTTGEYLTVVVDARSSYSTNPAGPGDTAASMAAVVATLISTDYPGTMAFGGVITVAGAHDVIARTGAPVIMGQPIHRQRQPIRITAWAPSPADRNTIGAALDVLFKKNLVVTLPDTSEAIMTYETLMLDDNSQSDGIYRRDMTFCVEYATLDTWTAYEITTVQSTIAPADTPPTSRAS